MEDINMIYEGSEEFGEMLAEIHEEETEIHVVGDFWTIKDILSEIVLYEEFEIDNIVLINPDLSENDDSFCLSVWEDGFIDVFPAKAQDGYIEFGDDALVFVFEDVNSKIINLNSNSRIIEVDYCDGDCDNCDFKDDDGYITEYSHSDDGELCGYTRSKTENGAYYSESFYSTDPKIVQFQLNKRNF